MNAIHSSNLENKVVVVTGGSGVLGESFVRAIACAHAKVVILDLNYDKAKEIENSINQSGLESFALACNVLDKDSLTTAKDQMLEKYGQIDILINGAGGNHPLGTTDKEFLYKEDLVNDTKTFFDLDESAFRFVFDLNLLGTLFTTQVFAKEMVETGGSILNISSMNAFTPLTKIPAYSSAKAAVSNFTKWLAVHFSKVGIRVNAIAPGFFLTKQNEYLLLNEDGEYTARAKKIISNTPMSRFGNPEELTGALLFLIDEKRASFINGVVLEIDGGFNAFSGV